MIVAIIIIAVGLSFLIYCIWDTVRSKYRRLKEENENSGEAKNESERKIMDCFKI